MDFIPFIAEGIDSQNNKLVGVKDHEVLGMGSFRKQLKKKKAVNIEKQFEKNTHKYFF
jgi:hypothetical protein